jgi:ElaB/YqjD/DUF883 family membrane-anchored ribosome-binding protein
METTDSFSDKPDEAQAQIAGLRRQVEQLMKERVTPALGDAAQRVETAVRNVTEIALEQVQAISSRAREQPITALVIAAAIGYLIGRVSR